MALIEGWNIDPDEIGHRLATGLMFEDAVFDQVYQELAREKEAWGGAAMSSHDRKLWKEEVVGVIAEYVAGVAKTVVLNEFL